jgi:D-alanine-D-alanine ligase
VNLVLSDKLKAPGKRNRKVVPSRRKGREDDLQRQVLTLCARMNIAVIFGGNKAAEGAVINQTTNPRSWKSYEQVAGDIADALRRLGCRNVVLLPEDMRLGERLRNGKIDLAWLNTGGVQGYNSMAHAAAMLELFGIPYVGHDPLTAGLLDSKNVFKQSLKACGIPTAPFVTWHLARGPFLPTRNAEFKRQFGRYRGPFIVKPVSGRASHHVQVVDTTAELTDAVHETYLTTENHVLVEKYLGGREYCVAVCGPVTAVEGNLRRHDEPFVFAAVERMLESEERIFTSMDLRPITRSRVRALSEETDAAEIQQLYTLGRRVFEELHLETLVRLDVRADEAGNMFVLEANPKPDLKAPTAEKTSLVCASLQSYGMSYDDLILSLLADRIDLLFACRRGTVNELARLLQA